MSDTCHQAYESSSPSLTVRSLRFDAVLRLGDQIVALFESHGRVDMLTSWMAHYIAELMRAAEEATGEERIKKQDACAEAILSIWEHRHRLPGGMRPFADFESVFAALQRLDPQLDGPHYFPIARLAANEENDSSEVSKWLGVADSLDYAARTLIRYFLACAARDAVKKSEKWVALAEEVGEQRTFELPIIRIITAETDLIDTDDPDEAQRKLLTERIAKLDAFRDLAISTAADLRRQLHETQD